MNCTANDSRNVSIFHGLRRRLALSVALAVASGAAMAQPAFPSKPLLFVSPFAPGPGPDIYLRPLTAKLAELLGQNVVLDNKVGFGGSLAAQQVAERLRECIAAVWWQPPSSCTARAMASSTFATRTTGNYYPIPNSGSSLTNIARSSTRKRFII